MAQHTFRVSLPTSVNTIKKTLHRHAHGQSDLFLEKVFPGDSELWQGNWIGPPSLFRTCVSHPINGQIEARINITSNARILGTHMKNSSGCSFDVAWASNIWLISRTQHTMSEWDYQEWSNRSRSDLGSDSSPSILTTFLYHHTLACYYAQFLFLFYCFACFYFVLFWGCKLFVWVLLLLGGVNHNEVLSIHWAQN